MWNGDPANQHTGRRNYADGAGASTLEGMGYRFAYLLDLQLHVWCSGDFKCVFFYLSYSCSSKGSTMSRRGCKKTSESSGKGDEGGRVLETQVPLEDLERNQKIMQWMMEGDKQRKGSHG